MNREREGEIRKKERAGYRKDPNKVSSRTSNPTVGGRMCSSSLVDVQAGGRSEEKLID